ncbi:MAG: glycosyltransferase family 39 protein [Anaerolineales bacterium]|nr:glycosyltransferase family 39 protein [Anaerolineales bacterium]
MRNEKLEIRKHASRITHQSEASPWDASRQTIGLVALVITAIGFALRLYALGRESLWYDELLQLDIAQGPLSGILPQLPRHTAVPLDYFISHAWILLGRQDAWVRLPAVMIGTLTLPLAYWLGRRLLGRSEGLLLMALLALSPFHIRYSQEARPYALVVLGVILAVYALWRFRATGQRRDLVILQIGVLIFALAHLFALVIFVPFALWAGLDFIFAHPRRTAVKTLGALVGTGTVALVILLALGYGSALYYSTREFGKAVAEPEKFTVEAEQKPNQGDGPRVDDFFIKNQILGPLGAGDAEPVLWLVNGLAGLGLLYLLTQKRYGLSLLLSLWIVLPIVVIVAFLVYRGTFFSPRYIISTLPAYLILLTVGLLALPRWLKCAEPGWVSKGALLILSGLLVWAMGTALNQLYVEQKNENWRLVSQFLAQNSQPGDAIIPVNAEATMNWYYPPARAELDRFDTLVAVQAEVAQARRSWVIISIFSNYIGEDLLKMRAWLGEQGAIRLVFDPVIDVYYLGSDTNPPQLLKEIQTMALPVDHALYASLARENRRDPAVARRYYELAIDHAPDEETRAEYQAALAELNAQR